MKKRIKRIYQLFFSEKQRIKNRLLFNQTISVFYRGNTCYCNCCGKSFRKFKPKGTALTKRENAECPYCGSLERVRNLLFYIENETGLLTGKFRLLHFAPEWCLLPVFKKAANLDYITADINPDLADHVVDIMDIPFEDESFDYIICFHVLGHVPDEKKAIEEMYRVLKPEGTALIATIIDLNNPHTFETDDADTPQKRLYYYSEPDLLRLHGTDFDQRLTQGGFKVEMIDYPSVLGEEIKRKYVLGDGKRELIFKCVKN
ncbi:MAG: class I SAM-dependent methyltransferase [Dysgonamonadaceae bacterium]|jgi:SAM-dependent methyltransferase|nr:class I SAM-dependent methyltransferase [Dysgonamonadaceae bacterium]